MGALVRDSVAVAPTVARWADAGVVVDSVLARAAVDAGVACALVDVDLAALAGKSRAAATHPRATVDLTQTTYRGRDRGGRYQQSQLTLRHFTTRRYMISINLPPMAPQFKRLH